MGRRNRNPGKGTFDPDDKSSVKHTKIGVWDLYEEIRPEFSALPKSTSSWLESRLEIINNYPYVLRMLNDISHVKNCRFLLALCLAAECVLALIPALTLWYQAQFLKIVEGAINERSVDTLWLIEIAAGQLICSLTTHIVSFSRARIHRLLNARIRQFYSTHNFRAWARLDVPTFNDPAVMRQLESAMPSRNRASIAWTTINSTFRVFSIFLDLISRFMVLLSVLRGQRDGLLLATLSFMYPLWTWATMKNTYSGGGVWAATTTDYDYIRSQGLKKVVSERSHRQEIVACGLWEYMYEEYAKTMSRLGENAGDFATLLSEYRNRGSLSLFSLLVHPIQELPKIVFTFRAIQYPADIPVSLASLNLITSTASNFTNIIFRLIDQTGSIADQFANVRKVYEVVNIPNRIQDGKEPFPENQRAIADGIGVEFRNVSFKYPGSDAYALRNVSFKIGPGQLCVIVGANGSGKSTILKLFLRLYDPVEGQILLDGRDIKTLKLADLRRAISVLFQDYTHFPLSIKDNIGMGDPAHAQDEEKIQEAARLGGADGFINKLPDGMNTYLDRPVGDFYSDLPEGTTSLFGRSIEFSRVRGAGKMSTSSSSSLSGGQMQRIALSRTFMRSLVSEPSVGLLLFDEPSASLDPTAEHDLFERLRKLRGSKTMLFSSHRFGNLTRHADVILYMDSASVVEEGTHDQLLAKKGEYERIWMLQAQAFL